MAGDWRKRVTAGDPFRGINAQFYNKLVDLAAKDALSQGQSNADGINLGSSEGLRLVKNVSGATVARFGILTLEELIVDPTMSLSEFSDNAAFQGHTPSFAYGGFAQFGIAFEPIAANAIGKMWVFGVCPVQVNFTNATDAWADVLDGDTGKLQSNPTAGGAFVLWKQAGTGTKWAVIRIGNMPSITVFAKLVSNTAYAGKYNGTIYDIPGSDDGTGDLALPDGMTAGASCLVIYTEEDAALSTGSATHRLDVTSPSYVVGTYGGMSKETPPRPIVIISKGFGRTDNPKVLPGGACTPDTTTWNRQTDGKPVQVEVLSSACWNTATNTLSVNKRVWLLDACGVPYSISAETAVTVDVATACSS